MEQNFNPYTTQPQKRVRPNTFELAAFGLAITSILSCSVIYMAYLFAGLAILFALLSRGAQMQFSPKAKQALLIGIAGIILSTIVFISSFLYLLEVYGSLEGILRAGSEMMGIDFETEFGSFFQ